MQYTSKGKVEAEYDLSTILATVKRVLTSGNKSVPSIKGNITGKIDLGEATASINCWFPTGFMVLEVNLADP